MGKTGEAAGELLGAFDAQRFAAEKFLKDLLGMGLGGSRGGSKRSVRTDFGKPESVARLGVHEPAEFEVIGQQKVR